MGIETNINLKIVTEKTVLFFLCLLYRYVHISNFFGFKFFYIYIYIYVYIYTCIYINIYIYIYKYTYIYIYITTIDIHKYNRFWVIAKKSWRLRNFKIKLFYIKMSISVGFLADLGISFRST